MEVGLSPDMTLPDGHLNPEWLDEFRVNNARIGTENPGTLVFDKDTKRYSPKDPYSPIGQVQYIQEFAQEALDLPPDKKLKEKKRQEKC